MHINRLYFKFILVVSVLLFASEGLLAQKVWENPNKEIYQFLSRQAQKGNIDLDDLIQPYSRKDIAFHLSKLDSLRTQLSPIEIKELDFYRQEYAEFNDGAVDEVSFLKKDQHGRLRFLAVRKDDFILNGDPTLSIYGIQGTQRSITGIANGAQFWGQAGKHIAFQAGFTDNTEKGDGIDKLKSFTPETGVVRTEGNDPKSLNFSDFRGSATYNWQNGSISVGYDQLTFGYGANGKLVLSDKAPAAPFIRLDYKPLKWLSFNYIHTWLNSAIIDSNATYNKGNPIYGDVRESYIQKYMASHSLTFYPTKGLSLTAGESVIYTDKLEAGYLFPLMFFKVYDQHASRYKISTGSNSQFFFQASSRNLIKNTHLYATLFIDEISFTNAFNAQKSRNQLGYNLGASVTDIGIPYLTIGAEYTRLNPFNYQNLIPAQNYTHHDYTLGDWMGANADRFLAYLKYTPISRLKTSLTIQSVRKGNPGSLLDQYFKEPQPKFLDDYQFKQNLLQLNIGYEVIHNLYFNANYQHISLSTISTNTKQTTNNFKFGLSLGF
ncbi:capsule assembly Wzi family protein [Pedobacter flavus]|uniref:Capsule assembly Wzi family protein n=1 Tax=Pedobacter flavus TaxID=3113906 RepID=A0ABU7H064_9SPHI|nr:capsule assembly Wzi family protein [Pedobacter sp. VNH31]MEE1884728.1 capsule assembly Wzi family protein [Pedobacter sp. VNH31]